MRKLIGLAFYLSFKIVLFIQFRYKVVKSLYAEILFIYKRIRNSFGC